MIRSVRQGFIVFFAGFAFSACSGEHPAPIQYSDAQNPEVEASREVRLARLVEVQRYGIPDQPASDSVRAGGAVLAQIAKAVDDDMGRVYVLDAGFKKIAVFSPRGTLDRVILGGHGEGPGEFKHPTSLWVTPDGGTIAVFDYSQGRVSLFDGVGEVIETHPVPRAKDVALFEGRIIGTRMPGVDFILWILDTQSGRLWDSLRVDPGHSQFYPRGSIARIGQDRNGAPLIGHHRPGLLLDWTSANPRFIGTEILGDREAKVFDGIAVSPGATVGVGEQGDGSYLVAYVKRDLSDDQRPGGNEHFIEILSPTGLPRARVNLGEETITSFHGSRDGTSILLSHHDPYPYVARYVIEWEQP
jgi:hypothetical protein